MRRLQNPIKEYKLKKQLTYAQIAEKMGLPEVTVKDIASANKAKLKRTSIDMFIRFKKIGINLAQNLKY